MKLFLLFLVFVISSFASSIPSGAILVASYHSSGLYNLVGLETWNGSPVSPTNTPSDANREFDADINLFVDGASPNQLYIQLSNITTTLGAYWFGTAFENVTETGVMVTFPSFDGPAVLDSSYANVDEMLADGTSGTEVDSFLFDTPGYQLTSSGNSYSVTTMSGAEYGFSSLFGIYGARRIHGGGVFRLDALPGVDFLSTDFSSVEVDSLYGAQGTNQSIEALPLSQVPEPSEFIPLVFLSGLLFLRLSRPGQLIRTFFTTCHN